MRTFRSAVLALLLMLSFWLSSASDGERLSWSLTGADGWAGGVFINTEVEPNPGGLALARGPHPLWTASYDSGRLDIAHAVAVDRHGEIIVVGHSHRGGGSDTFSIIKYGPQGQVLWHRDYCLGLEERAVGVATDSYDNIIVVGYSASSGSYLYHLRKYDPQGNLLWSRSYTGGEHGEACAVAVDVSDNILVLGTANSDFLLAKYDPQGNLLWSRRHDGRGTEQAYGLAVDNHEPIAVGVRNSFRSNPLDDRDCYIVKFDPQGRPLWARRYGTADEDVARAVAVTPQGEVLVAGYSWRERDYDFTVLKYSSAGELIWAQHWDSGGQDQATGIAVDPQGNAVVVGVALSGRGQDYYALKFDPQGRLLWAAPLLALEGPPVVEPQAGVALDPWGNPIIVLNGGEDHWLVKYTDGFLPRGSYLTPLHGFRGRARLERLVASAELHGGELEAAIQVSDDRFATIKDMLHLRLGEGERGYPLAGLRPARYVRIKFTFRTPSPQASPLLKGFTLYARALQAQAQAQGRGS